MREIKFRAWDKENKCWYRPTHEAYKGNLFELFVSFSGDLSAHVMTGMEHQSIWPDRFELMQYTGLKDMNGVEIYEGDVLGCWVGFGKNRRMACGAVKWIEEEAKFDMASPLDQFEVIGNLYENPELLK